MKENKKTKWKMEAKEGKKEPIDGKRKKERKKETLTHWAFCRCPSRSERRGWRSRLGASGWCRWEDTASEACVGAWSAVWRRRGFHISRESSLFAAATAASAPTTTHGPTNHAWSLRITDTKQLSPQTGTELTSISFKSGCVRSGAVFFNHGTWMKFRLWSL